MIFHIKARGCSMSPRGEPLTQGLVRELSQSPGCLIVCGRFEGVDERVIEARALREVSVGDYILPGGEPAALVLLNSVVSLLPGVMGNRNQGLKRVLPTGFWSIRTTPSQIHGRGARFQNSSFR